MSEKATFSFSSFMAANNHKVSGFDYLCIVAKNHAIHADFLSWMGRLFYPEFKLLNNAIYVAALFDEARFQELSDNEHAQFWMNLLEITGMFEALSYNEAIEFAKSLVCSWNAKITQNFGATHATAYVLSDGDCQEVFVALGTRPDSHQA